MKKLFSLITAAILLLSLSACTTDTPPESASTASTGTGIRLVNVNSIKDCTDTTKLYALPDGYIYAYFPVASPFPAIETEMASGGFWYSDSWNPSGGWTANENCSAKRTSLISVMPGDILRYQGCGSSSAHSVTWLDKDQQFLSNEYYDSADSAVEIIVPEQAAFVWFSSFKYTKNPDSVMLNVYWEKCQTCTVTNQWANTGLLTTHLEAPISLDTYVNACKLLKSKKIVYDGDSICADHGGNSGAYPAVIADITGGRFENHASGGARLCSSGSRHSVVDNLVNLPKDGDLYCFEGGINDYWANIPIGECSATDFSGPLDTRTICGALETIFRYSREHFSGKPVCFVIVHQIQNTAFTANENGDTFQDYRDAMVQVCEKYSVPYYDAFTESGLHGWNETHNSLYLNANSENTPDGTHPNEEGYRGYYAAQLLELFLKALSA